MGQFENWSISSTDPERLALSATTRYFVRQAGQATSGAIASDAISGNGWGHRQSHAALLPSPVALPLDESKNRTAMARNCGIFLRVGMGGSFGIAISEFYAAQSSKATTSSTPQTWSVPPASTAGVTKRLLHAPEVVPHGVERDGSRQFVPLRLVRRCAC